ncbi:MAG: GNAT superfamily N-acetyltransferase [Acidimicrobiales bacterium]
MEAARFAVESDLGAMRWVAEQVLHEQADARGGDLFQRREAAGALESIPEAVAAGQGVVGTYDDVVLGYGIGITEELDDGSLLGRITALAVVADGRGSGIGEAIMNAMLERLRSDGCIGVDATALPGDRHTKNFFESFGLKARLLVVHRSFG